MTDLEQTRLWQSFAVKASTPQKLLVENLVAKATARLDLVRDTFPTYTLHNHVHALNVVRLIDQLLGAHIDNITALEGAILILSAYLHDIGMVFTEEERENLQAEADFEHFLKRYPEAFVMLKESGRVTTDLAEWYCRWMHARRVHHYLAGLEEREISWGQVPIERHLGLVCESHNMDVGQLRAEEDLKIDFLFQADLLFCAIILRLADILDFDNTRSPDEVYKYLGLSKRETRRKQISDVEWHKHLHSDGFRFPPTQSDGQRYMLKLIAAPDHPAVEYDIREFLEVIESELKKCTSLLGNCAEKWRSHPLPQGIDRDGIISKGYKYGEYRFTLEQDQILDLLMGENLYSDPYVFVRELIQNAIDATRHREFYEHGKGNSGFRPAPIKIASWTDKDGYQWVRIDDAGMGMDEGLIANYLLKVGRSYYRSAEFKAELLRYEGQQKQDFMPISRFGIGMLSCFIIGDRVEVSTRRATANPYDACGLRLSMSGLRSFYTLYVEKGLHRAPSMPNATDTKEDYRQGSDFGTSVAVRFDPRRDHARFNLADTLANYVLFPPVPIQCDGREVSAGYQDVIETPWMQPIETALTDDEMRQVEQTLNCTFSAPIVVRLLPLDLTAHSPTPNLAGQALLGYVSIPVADRAKLKVRDETRGALLRVNDEGELVAQFTYEDDLKLRELRARQEQQELEARLGRSSARRMSPSDWKREQAEFKRSLSLNLSRIFEGRDIDAKDRAFDIILSKLHWLSHNGIAVPTKKRTTDSSSLKYYELRLRSPVENGWFEYKIALRDSLRPDISLSRDELRSLPWRIYSSLALALSRALKAYDDGAMQYSLDIFERLIGQEYFSLDTILDDPNIVGDDSATLENGWASEPIIATSQGKRSIRQIQQAVIAGQVVELNGVLPINEIIHGMPRFVRCCAAALIQMMLDVEFEPNSGRFLVRGAGGGLREGQKLFPPLFFVPYSDQKLLRVEDNPLNLKHPFAEWLVEHAPSMREAYPGIFDTLRRSLSMYLDVYRGSEYIEVTSGEIAGEVNTALERLRQIKWDFAPPDNLNLQESDFRLM